MMNRQESEKHTEGWVPSYVEVLEKLHGPLIQESCPEVEEINEILINNFMEEVQDTDQGLNRWIQLYLALLDFIHGVNDQVPGIEIINQEWINCFLNQPVQIVDQGINNWISAYLGLEELLNTSQEHKETPMPIEAVNQEWINCFYTTDSHEENDFIEWEASYLDIYEQLHGSIQHSLVLSIEQVNAEWSRIFRVDEIAIKALVKAA